VRSLAGHTAKQQWNPEAIRAAGSGGNARRITDELRPGRTGQEADRLAFLKDFLENLDLKRTFGRMPMQQIRDALYEIWVPLKNGDHFEYSIPHDDPILSERRRQGGGASGLLLQERRGGACDAPEIRALSELRREQVPRL
jgi:hypothetical protein